MSLPILTTADDVREIVKFLKNKPTGATVAEAKAVIKKRVLDPRKITAYQHWGIVSKDGYRLKLASVGWELARKPETEVRVFRTVLDSIVPYRSVLEWIYHQNLDTVTDVDVVAHWHEHHKETLSTDNENTIKDMAVCFFHLCQVAALGELTIGRQGKPTRLQVNKQELGSYWGPLITESCRDIWAGALKEIERQVSPPTYNLWFRYTRLLSLEEGRCTIGVLNPYTAMRLRKNFFDLIRQALFTSSGREVEISFSVCQEDASATVSPEAPQPTQPMPASISEKLRVFISHGKNKAIVEQVQTMLNLADIESVVAEKEETAAIPVPDKVFNAMCRCQAGIIVVSVEEGKKDSAGSYVLNENVLIEIGAAFVLYERRVVLLWDKRLPVPSNLQGLYRCEFEANELTWSTGTKLMKAIQSFKK